MKITQREMMLYAFLISIFFSLVISQGRKCAISLSLKSRSSTQGLFSFNSKPRSGRCITFNDVETAFLSASSKTGSPILRPEREWTPEEVKTVGELLLETTSILAKKYSLDAGFVSRFLPQIDTTKTSILKVCPPFASPLICSPGRYRRFDGLCNNLQNPTWGAVGAVFQRLLPPLYSDGVSSPRKSGADHSPLPSPRLVSTSLHRHASFHHQQHAVTSFLIAWGQLMDHDFTHTAVPSDPVTRNEPEDCCGRLPSLKNPYCYEIQIPPEDEFYNFRTKCLNFVRGFPGVRQNCHLGHREQFNTLSSVIDANTVYGGTDEAAKELRLRRGGLLKDHQVFSVGQKPLLPLKTDLPDEGCIRSKPSQQCFLAGETRVNEIHSLVCIHTLMMREHNRIAKELSKINPHWNDGRLYQETRHIVAAEMQHVTFNEFLPKLLGHSTMREFDLVLKKDGHWNGYDSKVNPSMISAFIASAFRFGHSLLPSTVERWSSNHQFIRSQRLSALIRQPFDLLRSGRLDEYLLGMINQPAETMDNAITQEVINHLFQEPEKEFGLDLVAFNIQRGRDFGLPSYNAFRKFCGLHRVYSFRDLTSFMTNLTVARFATLYKHVDDIDLFSGGISELPKFGSLIGPTFSCIIGHQMSRLRKGDRFWYELPNQPSSFTSGQLQAIRRIRLARLICDNSDQIKTIQLDPFILHDHDKNPRANCRSAQIPRLDLTPWANSKFLKNFPFSTTVRYS